jgi:hypothetical protein
MGWDGMGWDGIGWDGMGWDGDEMRCEEMEGDGTGWWSVMHRYAPAEMGVDGMRWDGMVERDVPLAQLLHRHGAVAVHLVRRVAMENVLVSRLPTIGTRQHVRACGEQRWAGGEER